MYYKLWLYSSVPSRSKRIKGRGRGRTWEQTKGIFSPPLFSPLLSSTPLSSLSSPLNSSTLLCSPPLPSTVLLSTLLPSPSLSSPLLPFPILSSNSLTLLYSPPPLPVLSSGLFLSLSYFIS